jgi:hypothetical protein
MGITVEFIVGCIGVLIAGATTMELATSKVFKVRVEQGAVTAMRQTLGLLFGGPNVTISD